MIFWRHRGKVIEKGGESVNKKEEKIITDPQGSYTGRPVDRYEVPVQDADDL